MSSGPDYVLTRDFRDNNRINLQHYQWRELFGYLSHPSIEITPHMKIADIGTGTGVWLTDLAPRLPKTVKLDGLDVSFAAAPPPKWLPSNVTLHRWDVNEAVPPEFAEQYDLVHIRNFAFVLRDEDIPRVLGNLVRLIKPGGHLQWGEPDMASFRIERLDASRKIEALSQLLQVTQSQDARLTPTWVPGLPGAFRAAGLRGVVEDVRDPAPDLALAMHECNLVIHELLARQIRNQEVAGRVQQLIPQVAEETREGAYWIFTRWTVVGRKPGV
ncbi:S-adenosyl-L-methionine-dependent methyltransferase [Xylariomycetidae sp. FL0641]|nr:S-adenosyl-L-methionine-dependent methyltransferase [Xylariomycetidae sp. FL0641]